MSGVAEHHPEHEHQRHGRKRCRIEVRVARGAVRPHQRREPPRQPAGVQQRRRVHEQGPRQLDGRRPDRRQGGPEARQILARNSADEHRERPTVNRRVRSPRKLDLPRPQIAPALSLESATSRARSRARGTAAPGCGRRGDHRRPSHLGITGQAFGVLLHPAPPGRLAKPDRIGLGDPGERPAGVRRERAA